MNVVEGAGQVSREFVKELYLSAGSAARIEWSLESKDIDFDASFLPADDAAATAVVRVHRAARGDHRVAAQPTDGVLRMHWDNRFSYFTSNFSSIPGSTGTSSSSPQGS